MGSNSVFHLVAVIITYHTVQYKILQKKHKLHRPIQCLRKHANEAKREVCTVMDVTK